MKHKTYRNRPITYYRKPLPQRNIKKKNTLSFAAFHPTKREVEQGEREPLWHVHTEGDVVVATDGFRLHIADNLSDKTDCEICENNDKKYPDFNIVIPNRFNYRFSVDALEIRQAVVTCGIFAEEGSKIVRLYFHQDKLVVESNSVEFGSSSFDVSLENDIGHGEGFVIAFNYRYLIDAIDHCSLGSGNITISAYKSNAPILMSGETNSNNKAVLMPMSLR